MPGTRRSYAHRAGFAPSRSSILLLFGLGMALAFFLFAVLAGPKATQLSLWLVVGTAMSLTAFPVPARFLTARKLLGTNVGTLALPFMHGKEFEEIVGLCISERG